MKHKILFPLFFLLLGATYGQTKLIFKYDAAGNQIRRQYCSGTCTLTPHPAAKSVANADQTIADSFDDNLDMYPNPTSGKLQIKWSNDMVDLLQQIAIVNLQGVQMQKVPVERIASTVLDLSGYPTGTYLAQFLFSDGSTRINTISYGGGRFATGPNKIQFNYSTRVRPEQVYMGGVAHTRKNILTSIEVRAGSALYRKHQIAHKHTSLGYSLINSITESNGKGKSLFPITFNYDTSSDLVLI